MAVGPSTGQNLQLFAGKDVTKNSKVGLKTLKQTNKQTN